MLLELLLHEPRPTIVDKLRHPQLSQSCKLDHRAAYSYYLKVIEVKVPLRYAPNALNLPTRDNPRFISLLFFRLTANRRALGHHPKARLHRPNASSANAGIGD
jgi:hypothetical protein